jgi:predicted deacylase
MTQARLAGFLRCPDSLVGESEASAAYIWPCRLHIRIRCRVGFLRTVQLGAATASARGLSLDGGEGMRARVEDVPGTTFELTSGRMHGMRRLVFGREGPSLGVVAGIHGNEFNGVATIYSLGRLLELLPDSAFCGRIELYPAVNPDALNFDQRRSTLSPVYADINRLFTSVPHYQDTTGAIAGALFDELIGLGFVIDLHSSAGVFNEVQHMKVPVPEGDGGLVDSTVVSLVRRCNLPVAICHEVGADTRGVLSQTLVASGGKCLVMEGGTTSTVNDGFVASARVGLINMMESFGVLRIPENWQEVAPPPLACALEALPVEPSWFQSSGREWVDSPSAGVFLQSSSVRPGDYVEEGDRLGEVVAADLSSAVPVCASHEGYLLAIRKKLPTHEGAQVARILQEEDRLAFGRT